MAKKDSFAFLGKSLILTLFPTAKYRNIFANQEFQNDAAQKLFATMFFPKQERTLFKDLRPEDIS